MTRLPRASGKAVVSALQGGGYVIVHRHSRGGHVYLRKPGLAALVTVPVHSNQGLPAGAMRANLRQAGLSVDEMVTLLTGSGGKGRESP